MTISTASTLEQPTEISAPGGAYSSSSYRAHQYSRESLLAAVPTEAIRAEIELMLTEIEDINAPALDAVCGECAAPLSWAQWLIEAYGPSNSTLCATCGKPPRVRFFERNLPTYRVEEIKAPGYFERTWYHATDNPCWAEDVQSAMDGELLIHAGSKIAALSRAVDLRRDSGEAEDPLYLHSFRLSATDSMGRTVIEDADGYWPETLSEALESRRLEICAIEGEPYVERFEKFSFEEGLRGVPYYNRYELPGDISLLLHAGLIDLESVETVDIPQRWSVA